VLKVTEPKASPPATRHILVVDDNPAVTKALSLLMKQAGYEAVPCACGSEALHYANANTPAAAVVDIHLPDINGLILSQQLREKFGPNTPIIVVSGDTSMETIKSLTHAGATYFFSKPLNSSYLIERIKELLSAA
jgi:DNA-binding response OmpR family regulator